MERRKIIIYTISVLVFAYGIYFHLFSGEGLFGNQEQTRDVAHPIAASVKIAAPAVIPPQESSNLPKSNDSWVRNPFSNNGHGARRQSSAPILTRREAIPPRISAISNLGGEKMAIVDGKLLQVGEYSGEWRLVKIDDDRALFAGPDGNIWVKLGG